MRILFIVDPLSTFKTYKDSTFAMMREAAARGYAIYTCLQSQLTLANNVVETVATPIALTGDEDDWYRAGDARLRRAGRLRRPRRGGDLLRTSLVATRPRRRTRVLRRTTANRVLTCARPPHDHPG